MGEETVRWVGVDGLDVGLPEDFDQSTWADVIEGDQKLRFEDHFPSSTPDVLSVFEG